MTKSYGEGDAFPDFSMETPEGGTVTKADLAGKKAVIFFYPKDNTPGCMTEAKDGLRRAAKPAPFTASCRRRCGEFGAQAQLPLPTPVRYH